MRNKDILFLCFYIQHYSMWSIDILNIFEFRKSSNAELVLALLYEMFLCVIFAELYFDKKDKNENDI